MGAQANAALSASKRSNSIFREKNATWDLKSGTKVPSEVVSSRSFGRSALGGMRSPLRGLKNYLATDFCVHFG